MALNNLGGLAEQNNVILQVFDLGELTPDKVLRTIYANIENLKLRGDQFAMKTMERLKLIVSYDSYGLMF